MISRTNTILGGLALIIITLAVGNWWFNRSLKKEIAANAALTEELYQLRTEKDSVVHRADSIQIVLDRYAYIIDSFDIVDETNQHEINRLNSSLKIALTEVKQATADANYTMLQEELYVDPDSIRPYGFTAKQVSLIAIDVVEGDGNKQMLAEYEDLILNMRGRVLASDKRSNVLEDENEELNVLVDKLYAELTTKIEEGSISEQEIRRLKKALRMWQLGALGGGAFVVLILLLL